MIGAYEALYGFPPKTEHARYETGIKLFPYAGAASYYVTYGTPEDPNAGKRMLLDIAFGEIDWTPRTIDFESRGLFQQHESSWGAA